MILMIKINKNNSASNAALPLIPEVFNDSASHTARPLSFEIFWITGILFVFLTIGSIESSKLTIGLDTWWDEIMHVDPAANLYFGQGFKSSAWFAQSKDEFWAGYPPLYPFLLYLWMRVFGFSLSVARSLNYSLLVFSAFILWIATIRLNLITSAIWRVFLLSLLLVTFGYIFLLRPGRPDVLMAALALIAVLAYSIETAHLRYLALAGICAIFPFSGVALIAYTVVFSSLVLIYLKQSFIKEFLAISTGLAIGSLGLCGFYYMHGVWSGFLASILTSSTLSSPNPKTTFLDKLILNASLVFNDLISFRVLLLSILAIVIYKLLKREFIFHSLASFGLVAGLSVPFLMRTAGAYPSYYNWMACIPISVCICSEIPKLLRSDTRRWLRSSAIGLTIVLLLFAPPLKLFTYVSSWQFLDHSAIENFVRKNVNKDDWVVGDPVTYYALKRNVEVVFHPFYLNTRVISEQEKVRMSVIIAKPHPTLSPEFVSDFNSIKSKLGGNWFDTGQSLILQDAASLFSNKRFELRVYKKK
jgi:hypothetical protein